LTLISAGWNLVSKGMWFYPGTPSGFTVQPTKDWKY